MTTPSATVALGRSINAAALLSASLKPESTQSLTYKINCSGAIKEINVQADALGNIRGYIANPSVDLDVQTDKINLSKMLGAGLITVTKDLGLKDLYSGVSPLLKGEIAYDTAYYLTTSEQVPSAVIIGLNLSPADGQILSSGGILIQTLPDTEPDIIELIEKNIVSLKEPLGDRLAHGTDILNVVSDLFEQRDFTVLNTLALRHKCQCSRERMLNIIQSIDKTELNDMLEKEHSAEITCTFCNTVYRFSEDEVITKKPADSFDTHTN